MGSTLGNLAMIGPDAFSCPDSVDIKLYKRFGEVSERWSQPGLSALVAYLYRSRAMDRTWRKT